MEPRTEAGRATVARLLHLIERAKEDADQALIEWGAHSPSYLVCRGIIVGYESALWSVRFDLRLIEVEAASSGTDIYKDDPRRVVIINGAA